MQSVKKMGKVGWSEKEGGIEFTYLKIVAHTNALFLICKFYYLLYMLSK
jgi:hypothetical protein